MKPLKRGDKVYLDQASTKESAINQYLDCRDGIVECAEYVDESGYGANTRLFLCENTKHESKCIVRQTWRNFSNEWTEESMYFDSYSFFFLESLINGQPMVGYTLVRNYNTESQLS